MVKERRHSEILFNMVKNPEEYESDKLKDELVRYLKSEKILINKEDITMINATKDVGNVNVPGSFYLDIHLANIKHRVQIQIFDKDIFAYVQK